MSDAKSWLEARLLDALYDVSEPIEYIGYGGECFAHLNGTAIVKAMAKVARAFAERALDEIVCCCDGNKNWLTTQDKQEALAAADKDVP